MDKDDGHFVYYSTNEEKVTIETRFIYTPIHQFDQAGLMLRYDANNWVKTGIEYVDGSARLSCVVTRDGWSDWSTQTLPQQSPDWHRNPDITLRLHRFGDSLVCETNITGHWEFYRIAHLESRGMPALMGPFACAPIESGAEVVFSYVELRRATKYHHDA